MILHKNKKAQETGSRAAILVAIITGFIILYILFLPPSERSDLLKESKTTGSNASGNAQPEVLLLEHPGKFEKYSNATDIDKPIPSFSLYTQTAAAVIKKMDSLYVKDNLFSTVKQNLTFPIKELDGTKNVKLSFNVDKSQGVLIVKLNGNLIYQKEAPKNVVLELSQDLLKESNTIEFEVDSPGWAFWRTNEYSLSTIQIVGDMTDTSKQEVVTKFVASSTEDNNLDSAFLRFYVNFDCKTQGDLDILQILLNNHVIYSQLPQCGGNYVKQEISPTLILSGDNTLNFKTKFNKPTTAVYDLDNILLRLKLKEVSLPVFYFELDSDQYSDVINHDLDLDFNLTFADDTSDKMADVFINGHKFYIDTRKDQFSENITDFAKKGTNAVKIVPDTTMDIVDLSVELAET